MSYERKNYKKTALDMKEKMVSVGDDRIALLKLQLVTVLIRIIDEKGWTQTRAAQELSMSRSRLCRLLGGQYKEVGEGRLIKCITDLGRDVQISIGPEHEGYGHILVVEDKT
jgi:predicted XRE-type DNA-binding protein